MIVEPAHKSVTADCEASIQRKSSSGEVISWASCYDGEQTAEVFELGEGSRGPLTQAFIECMCMWWCGSYGLDDCWYLVSVHYSRRAESNVFSSAEYSQVRVSFLYSTLASSLLGWRWIAVNGWQTITWIITLFCQVLTKLCVRSSMSCHGMPDHRVICRKWMTTSSCNLRCPPLPTSGHYLRAAAECFIWLMW